MATAAKPKTFLQKIAAAAAEMDNPKKRATNPHFKSKFANLGDTMDVIEPAMEAQGLAHCTFFFGTIITYSVFDPETGEKLESSIDLESILSGLDGNVWQQIGQAFTYLRRYLAQAFWGLVPEDDDAQSAPSKPAAQRKTEPVQTLGEQQDQSDATMRAAVSNGGGAL